MRKPFNYAVSLSAFLLTLLLFGFQNQPEEVSILIKNAKFLEHEDYDKSIARWQEILELGKENKLLHQPIFIEAGLSLAQCYLNRTDSDAALATLNLLLDNQLNDSPKISFSTFPILLKKVVAWEAKDRKKAKKLLNSLQVYRQKNNELAKFDGHLAWLEGKLSKDLTTFPNALALSENTDDTLLISNILIDWSFELIAIKKYAEAEKYLMRTKQLNQRGQGSVDRLLWAYFQLARIGKSLGKSEYFLNYMAQVNAINDEVNLWPENHYYRIYCKTNLSVSYKDIGEFDKAIDLMQAVINYHRVYQKSQLTKNLLNLGEVYREMEEYEKAIDKYQEAAALAKQNGNTRIKIFAKNNLFLSYTALKKYHEAEKMGQEVLHLKIQEFGANSDRTAKTYFGLGDLFFLQNDFVQAEHYLKKGQAILEKIDMQQGDLASSSRQQLAELYFKKRAWDKALEIYQEAVQVLSSNKIIFDEKMHIDLDSSILSKKNLLDALLGVGKCYFEIGTRRNRLPAINMSKIVFDNCLYLIDELKNNYGSEVSKGAFLSSVSDVYEWIILFHRFHYETKGQDEHLAAIFDIMEQSKAILLRDALQVNRAIKFANIPDSLVIKGKLLKLEIADLQKQQEDFLQKREDSDLAKLTEINNDILQKKQVYAQHLDYLERAYPAYYQLKHQSKSTSMERLQAAIQKEKRTLFIEYFLGDNGLVSIATDGHQILCHSQSRPPNLTTDINDFLAILKGEKRMPLNTPEGKAEFESFKKLSFYFYKNLLHPFLKNTSEIDQIVIVPSGELGYLPFEVLLTQKADDIDNYRALPYLFQTQKIRYAYAASFLTEPVNDNKYAYNYLGFAPVCEALASDKKSPIRSIEAENWDILFNSKEEVSSAAKLFGGKDFYGKEATKAQFLTHAPKAQILHLSTHAIVSDESPLYNSGFVFSDANGPTYLHAYELYNLDLKADLAILSACNTGTGKLQKGEGIMSLSRGFRYAGCPNILLSLWSVNDFSTQKLMTYTFDNLAKGQTKATALQNARKKFLSADNSEVYAYEHPSYWAAFVLIGDDLPLKVSSPTSSTLWFGMGLIAIFLLMLLLFLQRRKPSF